MAGERRVPGRALLAGALLVVVLVAAAIGLWVWLAGPNEDDLLRVSGRIEGRITTLTAKSPGRAVEILVDEGETVAAGAGLARLDDETQRARVAAAAAQIEGLDARRRALDIEIETLDAQTRLRIAQARDGLLEAGARVEQARATCDQAARDEARYTELAKRKVVPEKRAEEARLALALAKESCKEAEAVRDRATKALELAQLDRRTLDARRAEREALDRDIARAEAILAEQRTYLKEFDIRAPVAGTILTRTVELGERVVGGTPLFTLVDLDKLYVKVYVPEPRIGRIALGQPAEIRVDAYPDRDFRARISRIAQQAEFTPKNVETREERVKLVFAVEVALEENPDGLLKPGMPADATLHLAATPD